MIQMDRRRFLSAVGAAAAVFGFDPVGRRWLRAAEACRQNCAPIPSLDGSLVMDEASLAAASSDEGNIVHRRPWAVLRPGSVEDIAAMIRYCRCHDIPVAARGQGHSPFGQAQVEAGLVVEMAALATIHSIENDRADVDAGVLWKELFEECVSRGLTPPVLTGFTGLSIGGTLTMGGIGAVPRTGVQVDHVRALQVVTGTGRIVWCSPVVQRDLFEGVLSGLGQFGIITRAVVDLVPAPARTRQIVLQYTDHERFFRDLHMLLDRNEFENIYGFVTPPGMAVLPDPSQSSSLLGGTIPVLQSVTSEVTPTLATLPEAPSATAPVPAWIYQINLGKYYTGQEPDVPYLLRGVSDDILLRQEADRSYSDFILRVDYLIDMLKAAGMWTGVPHPWIDVFLPGQEVTTFVPDTMSRLNFDDVGAAGFVLLFPLRREYLTRRFFPAPDTTNGWVFLFDVLTSAPAPGPNTEFVAEKLRRNREIYDRAVAVGGKLYPISAVRLEPCDWAQQFGPLFDEFSNLKNRFDPSNIMTPGLNIFPR